MQFWSTRQLNREATGILLMLLLLLPTRTGFWALILGECSIPSQMRSSPPLLLDISAKLPTALICFLASSALASVVLCFLTIRDCSLRITVLKRGAQAALAGGPAAYQLTLAACSQGIPARLAPQTRFQVRIEPGSGR